MSMVFDTEALLAYYLGEPGGEVVMNLLNEVYEGKINGHVSIVNLTELYYILYRKSPKMAEEKERNLRNFKLKIVPVINSATKLWKEAARVKGECPVSLADAFAAATAKVLCAKLVTGGDTDFHNLKVPLLKIR
jgi:predicted nucleic acid-binding protein